MRTRLTFAAAALALCAASLPAQILVNSDITVSTTWTANNTYNLQTQIYVRPGATLTIQAGTVIASTPHGTGLGQVGGSLAVMRGGQIVVNGTESQPVIMTSTADVATWAIDPSHPTGHDPKTGTWRSAANEWGSLSIMGSAYIGNTFASGNVPTPDAGNEAILEGLQYSISTQWKTMYGGGNDEDDSGAISYLSIRYCGNEGQSFGNEQNGLTLGGVGRGTDIHHVDVMNSHDDGIQVFGGTVSLKYINVWNVGDDSFDVNEGWRGRAQFGLLVQGYCQAGYVSGVGDDSCFFSGCDAGYNQPITTATLYNFTLIGQPLVALNEGTSWTDNARVQYRNCVFVDLGHELVDHAGGYGVLGTLTWPQVWTTNWNVYSNIYPPAPPLTSAYLYQAQVDGKLAEIKDSVFFRNQHAAAYTEATAQGVFNSGNNNVLTPGFADVNSPVTTLTRGGPIVVNGKVLLPVTGLNPLPANAALASVGSAPANGFYTPANYRGAMPQCRNWLVGWTACDAFSLNIAPAAPPATLVVSGAEWTNINGTYTHAGTLGGRPYYTSGLNTMFWAGAYWNLIDDNEQRFATGQDTQLPPVDGWLRMPMNTPSMMTISCQ